jgi:predicted HTH transcriptional regulator
MISRKRSQLANTSEGVLVLGVDDQTREITGVPVDRLEAVERLIFEVCNDSIRPPVVFRIFRMELPDSTGTPRAIIKVEIPRSLFVHESRGGYFHRQGSSRRRMPPDLLARLFQQRSQARLIRFEEQAVPSSAFSDLDQELWQRFLGPHSEDPATTLRKMSLLTVDESGSERATVAGILMASKDPRRWLPGALIEAVRYRGDRPDSNYQIDAQTISGPLDGQIRQCLAFVRRNMRIAARKAPGRVELPEYSIRAVFEAVVNAVAHRDYSIHGSKIRLFLFDDRLELYSPGSLPNTVTIETIALRQSTRNELITTLLSRCPVDDLADETGRQYFMEKRGEGVPIILEESRKLAGRVPDYQLIDEAELRLTIWPAAEPDSAGEE